MHVLVYTLQLGARRPWVGPLVSGHPWRTCCRSEPCLLRTDRPLLPLAQQMVMLGPRKRTSPPPLQRQGTWGRPLCALVNHSRAPGTTAMYRATHLVTYLSCDSVRGRVCGRICGCLCDRTPRAQAASPVSASGVRDDNWFFSAPTLSGVRLQTLAFLESPQCGRGCTVCVHVRACCPYVRVCVHVCTCACVRVCAFASLRYDFPRLLPCTHQVDFSVRRGGFVAVVGEVGSGKTSLLMALMSELHATVGSVYVAPHISCFVQLLLVVLLPCCDPRSLPSFLCVGRSVKGSVAYVPQHAWIMSGTIQVCCLYGEL